MRKDLPLWKWLLLPVVVTVMPYAWKAVDAESEKFMFGELGIIENLTAIILIIAVLTGIRTLLWKGEWPVARMRGLIVLLTLGCIYFAGEELSWGQHWLGWDTPDAWKNVNDQSETNLHNTSALLDQLPRNLLMIAAFVGGLIAPIYKGIKHLNFDTKNIHYWLWPTYVVVPTCVFVAVIRPLEHLLLWVGQIPNAMDIQVGELEECLLAMFLWLYLASFYRRLRVADTT